MSFVPSLTRQGLDELLRMMPHLELVEADWQRGDVAGPWLLVTLGQQSDDGSDAFALFPFAIWKRTGAVYRVGADGAVEDDPILEPPL
jgi:hypothetical protein